jgi:transcriptional regulator with XRE-family HTH domain
MTWDFARGWRKGISAAAVRAFRERRGWTLEQMADEVSASPLEVAAWEAGTIRVPAASARRLREIAARDRHRTDALVPGPGRLPRCTWADANAPGLHEILFHTPHDVESDPLVQQHLETCEECQRVQRFGRFARTLPAVSKPGPDDPAEDLGYGLDSVPSLVLIPLLSVAGFAVFLLLRAVLSLFPDLPDFPAFADVWVETVVFFWACERIGKFASEHLEGRPYATGLLSGVGGMLAALIARKLRMPDADLWDPTVLAVCAAVTLIVGLLSGWIRDGGGDDTQPSHAGIVMGDTQPADAETVIEPSAPVPRLGEGAPPTGLDGVLDHRRSAARALDEQGRRDAAASSRASSEGAK